MLSAYSHRHGDGRRVFFLACQTWHVDFHGEGNLKLFSAALQMSGSMALRLGKRGGGKFLHAWLSNVAGHLGQVRGGGGISPLPGPAMRALLLCRFPVWVPSWQAADELQARFSESHVALSSVSLDARVAALVILLLCLACAVSALHASLEFERVPFGFEWIVDARFLSSVVTDPIVVFRCVSFPGCPFLVVLKGTHKESRCARLSGPQKRDEATPLLHGAFRGRLSLNARRPQPMMLRAARWRLPRWKRKRTWRLPRKGGSQAGFEPGGLRCSYREGEGCNHRCPFDLSVVLDMEGFHWCGMHHLPGLSIFYQRTPVEL